MKRLNLKNLAAMGMILTLLASSIPAYAADQDARLLAGGMAEAEQSLAGFLDRWEIRLSEDFDEHFLTVKSSLMAGDGAVTAVQDALLVFLNDSLRVMEEDSVADLVAYAQDYNSSRSNKYRSRYVDDNPLSESDQTRAQDYNSSRSNKPRAEIPVADEGEEGFLLEAGEAVEIRIPVQGENLILLENLDPAMMVPAVRGKNADVLAALVYTGSLHETLKAGMDRCEARDLEMGFFFLEESRESFYFLETEFFLPVGIGGDQDCDDMDSGSLRPDEVALEENDPPGSILLRIGEATARVDGSAASLEVSPFIEGGRTMVPLRFIGEALGAEIIWDQEQSSVTYLRGDDVLKLWIGENRALLNGVGVPIDEDAAVVPRIVRGRTVVPLRFVSEVLGSEVLWNGETQEITVKTDNPLYKESLSKGVNPIYEGDD